MTAVTNDPWVEYRFDQQVAALIEQRRTHCAPGCGWADYEIRAVRGEGGFFEHAIYALGFREENFNMQFTQAVSCEVCGGLFKESLPVMRRHRLSCGWD
jgi:hypothetical protein